MWSVPAGSWARQSCFVIGGGPSLRDVDVASLRGLGRVIVTNNAYQLAPWADALYWADRDWLTWGHVERVERVWEGGWLVSRINPENAATTSWPVKLLEHDRKLKLSRDPAKIAGWCSGANAINLAWLAGADPIVLLGFDGRQTGNWHNEHKRGWMPPDSYSKWLVPSLERMAGELKSEGARVINCTQGTALTCFTQGALRDFTSPC